METAAESNPIHQKTLELCEGILKHPDFNSLRGRVDSFLGNEAAKGQYNALIEQGQFLQHRQDTGGTVSQEEAAEFEQKREAVLGNPVIRDFLQAQEEIQTIQQFVGGYVAKTFELGRIPSEDDFSEGGCGSGCGCK
ncbi:MAG: YlbF family regulator [Verrucomicrobia bacterium]|nr:YlbF family regulator [Verrucomicrobiota bacterium]